MKNLIFITLLFFVAGSCTKENVVSNTAPSLKANTLKVNEEIPKSSMEFNIDKAIINGKTVTLTISHGGGCDPNHNFKLYKKIKATYDCLPDEYYIVFNTNDYCKRLDYSEITFDFSGDDFCAKSIVIKGGKKDLEIAF